MSRILSAKQIWAAPAALGVASAIGLASALLADGAGDLVSWLALAVPSLVCLWGLSRVGRATVGGRREKGRG